MEVISGDIWSNPPAQAWTPGAVCPEPDNTVSTEELLRFNISIIQTNQIKNRQYTYTAKFNVNRADLRTFSTPSGYSALFLKKIQPGGLL